MRRALGGPRGGRGHRRHGGGGRRWRRGPGWYGAPYPVVYPGSSDVFLVDTDDDEDTRARLRRLEALAMKKGLKGLGAVVRDHRTGAVTGVTSAENAASATDSGPSKLLLLAGAAVVGGGIWWWMKKRKKAP